MASTFRTLNCEQFEEEFPEAFDTFFEYFDVVDDELVKFRLDIEEDGSTVAWVDGEEFAVLDSEYNTWEEV